MDKEPQTKLVLDRTIAGQDYSDLSKRAQNGAVFSNFERAARALRAEDVFKAPDTQVPSERQKPVVVERRPKRIFTRPVASKPNEP